MDNNEVLDQTAPVFKHIIKTFLESDLGRRTSVEKVRCSSFTANYGMDRFSITLPYSDSELRCQIILNAHQPNIPVDFVFDDNFFMDNVEDMVKKVPSLVKWKLEKPEGLVDVATEFLEWYKDHHLQLMQEEVPEFYETYLGLIQEMDPRDIEPFLYWKDTRYAAKLTIKVPLNCSRVPMLLEENCRGSISLQIVSKANNQPKLAEVYVSDVLDEFFLSFPKALRPDTVPGMVVDMNVYNYVITLRTFIQDKVDDCCDIIWKRKEFILACISEIPQSLVEYDANHYRKVVFLINNPDGFSYLLHLILPEKFPEQHPTMRLISLYNANMGRPKKLEVADFPYNSDWSPEEIAQSFGHAIRTHGRTFKAQHVPQ